MNADNRGQWASAGDSRQRAFGSAAFVTEFGRLHSSSISSRLSQSLADFTQARSVPGCHRAWQTSLKLDQFQVVTELGRLHSSSISSRLSQSLADFTQARSVPGCHRAWQTSLKLDQFQVVTEL